MASALEAWLAGAQRLAHARAVLEAVAAGVPAAEAARSAADRARVEWMARDGDAAQGSDEAMTAHYAADNAAADLDVRATLLEEAGMRALRGALAEAPDLPEAREALADRLLAALSTSPDLTGDGIGDVIIGGYGSAEDGYAGAAWVVAGPLIGASTLDDGLTISGDNALDLAGNGVAGIGDVNGDGAPDLLVGAHGSDLGGDASGAASVFYGPLGADMAFSDGDRILVGEAADDELSRNCVGGRGDVDGDGIDDILVCAMYNSSGGHYAGATYLVTGSATASGTESVSGATVRVYGDEADGYLGTGQDLGDVDANVSRPRRFYRRASRAGRPVSPRDSRWSKAPSHWASPRDTGRRAWDIHRPE